MDIFTWHETNVLTALQDGVVLPHPPHDYCLAGDPALKHDRFGLALGHKEEDTIIIDGALAIGAEREINPIEVQKFILKIADHFTLREAVFDTWYYPETLELLRAQGTRVENHIVKKQDYDNFKRLVYQQKVLLPNYNILREEFATLITTGKKVDHPRRGSKDVADAVVNCVRLLSRQEKHFTPFTVARVF